jgi:hypothetical protein
MVISIGRAVAQELHAIEMVKRRRRQRARMGSMVGVLYVPPQNGKREVARRLRQIAAGQLKVG